MFPTLKNNIQQAWKNYSAEAKRRYNSIFEERMLSEIDDDYKAKKWISRAELTRLLTHRLAIAENAINAARRDYNDLLSSFNLNSMENFNTGLTKQLLHNKQVSL